MTSTQNFRDSLLGVTQQTKQLGEGKGEQAQKHSQVLGQTAQDKTGQAGDMTGEQFGQAKPSTADTSQATLDKATEANGQTGNFVQQDGDKVTKAVFNFRDALIGKKQ